MKQNNLFTKYLSLPGAKPLWQVAYESGAGSVDLLRQIGRGHRRAGAALARGIELSTGGVVSREILRPDDYDVVWGDALAVQKRIEAVQNDREAVRASYSGKRVS